MAVQKLFLSLPHAARETVAGKCRPTFRKMPEPISHFILIPDRSSFLLSPQKVFSRPHGTGLSDQADRHIFEIDGPPSVGGTGAGNVDQEQRFVPDLLVDRGIRIKILILAVDDGQRMGFFKRLCADGEECSPQEEAKDRHGGEYFYTKRHG
jgi:hypothetical protein